MTVRGRAVPRPAPQTLFGLAVGLALAAIGLRGGGGLQLGPTTAVEMSLLIAAGLTAAFGLLVANPGRKAYGAVPFALFGLLAAVTGLSILWAIQPSDAWLETNRTLTYLAVFGAAIVLARLTSAWWPALIGAIVLYAAIVCGWALLTKVFAGELSPDEVYARLRAPYEYWNAVGLTAALAVPACLWLGARRHGHAAYSALAYPVLALLILTMLLAYSRGSLLAAVLGAAVWFALVPLRLRGAAVMAVSTLGAVVVAAWAFSQDALTEDRVPVELRDAAGQELGIALVAMLLVLLAAGLAIGFASAHRAPGPGTRRTAGAALLVVLALMPIAFLGTLALSDRGLGGSISEGWNSLTDPDASTPPNDPGRLTAVGSVRARYWNESIKIFKSHKAEGVGAGGYATARPRFRQDDLDVRHSHGYVVQTAADLGLLGLLASLAFFVAFLLGALRACGVHLVRARRPKLELASPTPERMGLLTLLAVVVVFGVHSFVDWTWFVPGTALPAMLAAGWLAGRGPSDVEPVAEPRSLRVRLREGLRSRTRALAAAAVLIAALCAAWAAWQPYRSVQAGNEALAALEDRQRDPKALDRARELAGTARDRNPLSVEPLFEIAVIETVAGRKPEARRALEEAVRLQPANPAVWLRLADFALHQEGNAPAALGLLGPALYLDPRSQDGAALYLEASRGGTAAAPPPGALPTPAPGVGPTGPSGPTGPTGATP